VNPTLQYKPLCKYASAHPISKNLINSLYLNNMFAVLNIHMIYMQSGMLFCYHGVIPGFLAACVCEWHVRVCECVRASLFPRLNKACSTSATEASIPIRCTIKWREPE